LFEYSPRLTVLMLGLALVSLQHLAISLCAPRSPRGEKPLSTPCDPSGSLPPLVVPWRPSGRGDPAAGRFVIKKPCASSLLRETMILSNMRNIVSGETDADRYGSSPFDVRLRHPARYHPGLNRRAGQYTGCSTGVPDRYCREKGKKHPS
jgi:hypothetical protein